MDLARTEEDLLVLQPVELATLPLGPRAPRTGSGAGDGGPGLDRAGRLAVADADEAVPVERERGEAGQRALPAPGVVPEPAALGGHPDRPDRQLVADEHRLVPAGRGPGLVDHRLHALDDGRVRLAPGRAQRVPEVAVVTP